MDHGPTYNESVNSHPLNRCYGIKLFHYYHYYFTIKLTCTMYTHTPPRLQFGFLTRTKGITIITDLL